MLFSGRYDFGDGGYYCGEFCDGVVEGYGVCVSPNKQGEYSGKWYKGLETSGVYKWPSRKMYEGCWSDKKKHGLGVETKDKWIYRGEWTRGFIGRYGCKYSRTSNACYEGTWSAGVMDGYGVEVSADGGLYRGQWFQGMRHGHGVRISVPYEQAARYRPSNYKSLTFHRNKSSESSLSSAHSDLDESRDRRLESERGGFVLQGSREKLGPDSSNISASNADDSRKSLFQKNISGNLRRNLVKRFNKYRKTGNTESNASRSLPPSVSGSPVRRTSGSVRSLASADSNKSAMTDRTESQASFVSLSDALDGSVVETYAGEWKSDKRCGSGIASRSDGLKYEGEWFNNKKNGYGVMTFQDGTREEGKYRNNILVTALTEKKASIFAIRTARLRDQVDSAVSEAHKAAQAAYQKTEVANNRMRVARSRAEQASEAAEQARLDAEVTHQVSNKCWDDIIKDSDLGDSIRNSLIMEDKDNVDAKPSSNKEITGSSLIRQVLSSSFRKSFRRSIRSSKHSDKPQQSSEITNSRNEILGRTNSQMGPLDIKPVQEEEVKEIPATVTLSAKPSPKCVRRNFKDSKYSSEIKENSTFGLPRMSDFDNNIESQINTDFPSMNYFERSRLKRNKDPIDILIGGVPKSSHSPPTEVTTSVSPNFKSKNEIPLTATTPTGNKSFKIKDKLSWCLLVFFNIILAVFLLSCLHHVLV